MLARQRIWGEQGHPTRGDLKGVLGHVRQDGQGKWTHILLCCYVLRIQAVSRGIAFESPRRAWSGHTMAKFCAGPTGLPFYSILVHVSFGMFI